jgi:hypothetical protein
MICDNLITQHLITCKTKQKHKHSRIVARYVRQFTLAEQVCLYLVFASNKKKNFSNQHQLTNLCGCRQSVRRYDNLRFAVVRKTYSLLNQQHLNSNR